MSVNNVACLNSNRIRLKHIFLQAYFYCIISPIDFNAITCCNHDSHIELRLTIVCRIPCTNRMDHQLIFCLFQKALKQLAVPTSPPPHPLRGGNASKIRMFLIKSLIFENVELQITLTKWHKNKKKN